MTTPFILCLALIVIVSSQEIEMDGYQPATIDTYPYQVSIIYKGDFLCGGSIISEQWILTAAICIYEALLFFEVRVGSAYYDRGGVLLTNFTTVYIHELYDKRVQAYNVALIKMSTPLTFGPFVQSVALATTSTVVEPGDMADVTGWGFMSPTVTFLTRLWPVSAGRSYFRGRLNFILRLALWLAKQSAHYPKRDEVSEEALRSMKTPIIDQATCETIYEGYGIVSPLTLCAGFFVGRKDFCLGDFGAPLVHKGIQIGIVSWGADCKRGLPGVYTRVSAVRSWITRWTDV